MERREKRRSYHNVKLSGFVQSLAKRFFRTLLDPSTASGLLTKVKTHPIRRDDILQGCSDRRTQALMICSVVNVNHSPMCSRILNLALACWRSLENLSNGAVSVDTSA